MTIIAGAVTKNDGVFLAADSQTEDSLKSIDYDGKIWSNGDYVLGGAGELRAIQVVKHFFSVPEFREHNFGDIEKFLVKEVVPPLKEVMRENEVLESNKKVISSPISLIIGWDDFICLIREDFSVYIPSYKRIAAGSGAPQALGFFDNKTNNNWVKKDVTDAVKGTWLTAPGVGGNIYTVSTKNPKVVKFNG